MIYNITIFLINSIEYIYLNSTNILKKEIRKIQNFCYKKIVKNRNSELENQFLI